MEYLKVYAEIGQKSYQFLKYARAYLRKRRYAPICSHYSLGTEALKSENMTGIHRVCLSCNRLLSLY